MSYLVLARKYRPQQFSDVLGQEHITSVLEKAIESNRVAHAYLFCGPRGVGKTSCARILAQCLNCQDGPSASPDLNDPVCQDIIKGNSLDVLEIDGASNRGIDEIRLLRENVKFAATAGKYKIYIVDEVHMLTTEAFNALLKTLEEPPEHVKFIFATTEPNKVPATITSRTQRFDFKRIKLTTLIEAIERVCASEDLTFEADAVMTIAKAAQGGLRDALSILDQISALGESTIQTNDVLSMLGLVETSILFEMTEAIAHKKTEEVLSLLDDIIEKGKDIRQCVKDLSAHFRNLMIIKVGGKSLGRLVDYPVAIKEKYLEQAEYYSLKNILEAIEVLIEVQENARITENYRMSLEIALTKLSYIDDGLEISAPQKPKNDKKNDSEFSQAIKSVASQSTQLKKTEILVEEEDIEDISSENQIIDQNDTAEQQSTINLEKIKKLWDSLTHAVSRQKMSVATFLQEGVPYAFQGDKLIIGFDEEFSFNKETIEEPANKKLIEKTFKEKLGQDIILQFEINEKNQSKSEEPVVKHAMETFEGKVVSRWHNETK